MSTRTTIEHYFEQLGRRGNWQDSFADDMVFTTLTTPGRTVHGKPEYLESTSRFYASIGDVTVRELLVDGERACAFTRYRIRTPGGMPGFDSDVAELFTVQGDRITALEICFDTAPYPKKQSAGS